jgi:hypothetical protein
MIYLSTAPSVLAGTVHSSIFCFGIRCCYLPSRVLYTEMCAQSMAQCSPSDCVHHVSPVHTGTPTASTPLHQDRFRLAWVVLYAQP